jgi:SAM-dependent methyltransferase
VGKRLGIGKRPAAALLASKACMGILGVKGNQYRLYDSLRELVLEGGRARVRPRIPAPGEDEVYDGYKSAILTGQLVENALPTWVTHPQQAPEVTAFAPDRQGWRTLWGEALAEAFDFGPYRLVVDLGRATGGVLVGLAARYPSLRGIVVDLPYSQGSAEAALRDSGVADRVSYLAADFFNDPYPEGADLFLMSHIIHDWDDDHCRLLLRRCYEALPAGSPVMAMEFLLNEDKTGSVLAVFQWFGLLDGTYGDQRTAGEIAALMEEVGFRKMETRPVDGEHSIVIGWKG